MPSRLTSGRLRADDPVKIRPSIHAPRPRRSCQYSVTSVPSGTGASRYPQRATGMPNVVTSKANSSPATAATVRQVVNQTNGPRRLNPTKRAATPSRRDHTHVAKHSGLQRAIRRTSDTARYTASGAAPTVTRSATSSDMRCTLTFQSSQPPPEQPCRLADSGFVLVPARSTSHDDTYRYLDRGWRHHADHAPQAPRARRLARNAVRGWRGGPSRSGHP